MRRYIVVAAVLAILAGTASVGSGAELSVAHGGSADVVTAVASRPVASPGEFRVVVSLRANKRSETAMLYVPGEPERSLRLRAHRATTIAFKLVLKASTKKLRVRAVSPRPGVQLTLKLKREASRGASGGAPGGASLPSSGDAVTIPGASAGSPGGGTTPGSGLTTPDPGSTTPAPQAPDPYTKLLLDDEFAGAQGAPADSDGADLSEDVGDGDCGGGTVNTNTTSAANAALDGNGDLAITALDNGSGAYPYTSAQLESSFSDEYGAVEARIEVPPGQGLCSAFWLNGDPTLGDPPVSAPCSWPGCGEIDILEDLHDPRTDLRRRRPAVRVRSAERRLDRGPDERLSHLRHHLEPRLDRLDDRWRRIRVSNPGRGRRLRRAERSRLERDLGVRQPQRARHPRPRSRRLARNADRRQRQRVPGDDADQLGPLVRLPNRHAADRLYVGETLP
jgi:hypothetical protein